MPHTLPHLEVFFCPCVRAHCSSVRHHCRIRRRGCGQVPSCVGWCDVVCNVPMVSIKSRMSFGDFTVVSVPTSICHQRVACCNGVHWRYESQGGSHLMGLSSDQTHGTLGEEIPNLDSVLALTSTTKNEKKAEASDGCEKINPTHRHQTSLWNLLKPTKYYQRRSGFLVTKAPPKRAFMTEADESLGSSNLHLQICSSPTNLFLRTRPFYGL